MYLADRIAEAPSRIGVELRGKVWLLPGPSSFADAVAHCSSRYILQDDVQDACCQLAERWPDLLDTANTRLRAPMDGAWIEWTDPDVGEQVGMLVSTDGEGRAGALRVFWTQGGELNVAQGAVLFDFNRAVNFTHAEGSPTYRLRALPAAYVGMKNHLALAIDEPWADYFRATALGPHGLPEASSICGERLWPDVVWALAFFVLLASRMPFMERPILRGRLNLSRARAGKRALLDHVELRLGQVGIADGHDGGAGAGGRKHPRLHMVRGHLVRRRDSVFWRCAHIRGGASGDSAAPITRHVTLRKG